jgi:hypothetical protein
MSNRGRLLRGASRHEILSRLTAVSERRGVQSAVSYLHGLRTLGDRTNLGDGLGGHADDAVAGSDADGTSWPGHERTAPGLAVGAGNGDSCGAGRRGPPARKCGDHSQDQCHDGKPDASPQAGSGLPSGRRGAGALSGATDWISDPADSENRQGCGGKRGDGQRSGQPLDRARGRAVGSAQDAAYADEAEDGHLDGVPAAGRCRKPFQPIGRRSDRLGGIRVTWLHNLLLTPIARPFCTDSCGPDQPD